jgi:hypothetical protein
MRGMEAVDWSLLVQNAYGVDPEELLLQQEGQDKEEAGENEEDHF